MNENFSFGVVHGFIERIVDLAEANDGYVVIPPVSLVGKGNKQIEIKTDREGRVMIRVQDIDE